MGDKHRQSRREYLKSASTAGVVGAAGFAGCLGGDGGDGGGDGTPTGDGTTEDDSDSTGGQGGPISMGSILPITGSLSDYGSGMQQSVNLAVQHMNDAGGPLGRQIEVTNLNSQTDPAPAQQRYSTLVNENNIIGFVGAASSGVSVPLAQQVAEDQVMQVSNASTSPGLAELGYNDDESLKYFARTAPNDGQQGLVMGRILGSSDYVDADTAAFLFVDNAYGEGLARKARTAFQQRDGQEVGMVPYADQTTDYTSTLDSLFQNDPDAIGFIGYPGNGNTIVQQWANGGYGGQWVLSEGLNSTDFLTNNANIVSGMYMASPDPEETDGATTFEEAIGDANTLFAAHAYDAMFLMGLAIHQAGEASGTAIAENIRSVSRPGGENVTVDEFDRAKQLIDEGTEVNYQGASSPVNLNPALEPLNPFAIIQIQDDGSRETLEAIPRSFFEGKL